MTTARKPVIPPKPRITRPLAQPDSPKNPITQEVMQRVRRAIRDSEGKITSKTIAEEIDVSQAQMREWTACWRSMPGSGNDALVKIIRWCARNDKGFIDEVLLSKKIKTIGIIDDLRTVNHTKFA